ncbi:hypothetical protein ET445_06185 [Agromyces protaetiae]|uniref:Uncharacterized protein n=1 Tax=Agromyces protaetiae TaxID=2509455 RepID=A0A4P6FDD1_9MICO|nr:hypothetical protein [Agromyces protaetiae]QAY72993.1 hypothetical protein ET445_06185 [Agromyces protaetiae]
MLSRSTARRPRVLVALGLAVLVAGGVAGCSEAAALDPEPSASATEAPEVEPIFASDEEALAAAVEAYDAYLAVSNQILNDGGREPERIRGHATPEYAEKLIEGYNSYLENDVSTEGSNTFDTVTLSNWDVTEGRADVQIYLCLDVSSTSVFKHGVDVTPVDRQLRTALIITLEGTDALQLSGSDRWSGHDFCS